MAIGRYNAYLTDAPVRKDYISDAMQLAESNSFLYREERRKIADAKKAEEDAKNKAIADDFENFDKKLIPTITGYSSIDDPINMYAMDVKQKGVEWIREKNQTNDPYKKAEIQSKIAKATNSFDLLNKYPKIINDKKVELQEGIMKGHYNERDLEAVSEIAKSLDSGKYDLRVDENGVPRVTIFKTNENGEPIGVLEKGLSLGDVINRITPMQKPTYDIKGGIAEQIVTQIKLDNSKIQTGFTTITQEKLDAEKENALKIKAKEIAGIRSEAFELWQRMGNPPKREFNEEDEAKIADYVYKDLKSRYAEKYEKDIDQAGALAKKKFDAEEKEKEIVISTPTIISGTKNTPYTLDAKDGNGNPIVLQNGTKDFPIGNAIIKSGDGKQVKITNIYVSPGGKIRARVEEIGFEGASKKTTQLTEAGKKRKAQEGDKFKARYDEIVDITETDKKPKVKVLDFRDAKEIGPLALKMGYKGVGEMQQDFINRAGGDEFIITPDERNQPQKPKKTILRSELAAKAKASGYTPQEYEKLLKQNGVTIK